jgi:hypothetical protein
MLTKTKSAMNKLAKTLPPSADKAQCYNIANLALNSGTIAEAINNDHNSSSDAKRASQLMVDANCATENEGKKHCYGTFTFEDGSQL